MRSVSATLLACLVLVGAISAPVVAQPPIVTHESPPPDAGSLAARSAEGAAAMQAGRFEDAATVYAELVTQRPNDAGLFMNLGMARYMAGHPDQALVPLRKALVLQPSLAPASLFLGASLLDLGRAKEAAAPLQRAVTALPQNTDAREMLARVRMALGEYPSAATQYRSLTELEPESPRAWYGLARSYQGIAETAFAALQEQAPDSPLLELLVAEVAVTGDKFAAALAIYRRVLAGTAPVGGLHEAVAELYDRAGKPEWAAAELQKAPRRTPASCAKKRAECLFLDGKTREALLAARQEKSPVGLYWTIRAANRLATESVSRLETLPASVELHLIRAEIAQSQGRRTDAVTETRAALALAPGDATIETALAEALVRASNLEEALPLLDRLARDHPNDDSILLLYGDALLQSQRIDEAIPLLERAVRAEPSALGPSSLLGRAYVLAGKYEAALPHLQAAAAEDENGDVHYQLARAYQALQRMDEAKAAMAEYQKRHQQAAPQEPAGTAPDATLTPPD